MTFDEIAKKHGTDKASGIHNYMDKYEKHLKHMRDEEINILEIGVATGASLRAWEEIFPKANIYGIDIAPECGAHAGGRKEVFIGSQDDPDFLDEVIKKIGKVHIIIDDGSHRMDHLHFSFKHLFPKLEADGYYILEDLHTCYAQGGGVPLPRAAMPDNVIEFFKDRVSDLDFNGRIEGYGDKQQEFDYVTKKSGIDADSFDYYEEYILGISFYKSIIFVEKDNGFKRSDNEKN